MIEVSKQEDYKDRMRTEYIDLKAKINKLGTFVYSDTFDKLDMVRRELLVKQLRTMEKYLSILVERMEVEDVEYWVDDE